MLSKTLSGRNRTSDPVIADIYSHMLYQLSYAEGAGHQEKVWTLRGSNPRPPVCETGALPLS
jgi:hypothetical protein